jgi:hypothetical protein
MALAMRPLLLHAASTFTGSGSDGCCVLHFLVAPAPLSWGLRWDIPVAG